MEGNFFTTMIEEIESRLGVCLENKDLLREAFTHTSYAHEHGVSDNERLEFLGDSLLGFYVASKLYALFPDSREGDLTSIKAGLVEADACAHYTEKLGIDRYLLLGKGEKFNLNRGKSSRHADLFEAILGALFLDQGWEAVYQVLEHRIWPMMEALMESPLNPNWKAELQDYTQKTWRITPRYELLGEEGPEHEKLFTVGVFLDERQVGTGQGYTKKEAEKRASENALKELRSEDGN